MSSKIMLRADVSWAPTDDGQVVVLDMRTSRYLSLNTSGSLLWTKLSDGATRQDLVMVLVDRFGLSEASATNDVTAFLQSLRTRELIAD